MGRATHLTLAVVLLGAFTACGGGSSGDKDVTVKAAFVSSTGTNSSTTAGGAVVGVNVKSLSLLPGWRVGEPFEANDPIPPTDLAAQGEALLFTGPEEQMIDAVATPVGTVALVRDGEGAVALRLLPEEGDASEPLPSDAHRVLLVELDPLVLRVLLGSGVALPVARSR